MSSICIITLTGDRPLALSLCDKWVSQQTRKPDQRIVVDDGKIPMVPTPIIDYIRREPKPHDPAHTLNINMLEALKHVKCDNVVIFEDDDYYAPTYLEEMERQLVNGDVVGIGHAKYYHLPSGGYSQQDNMGHASLAQTAFKASMIPFVESCAKQNDGHYLDVRLWLGSGGSITGGEIPPSGHRVGKNGWIFKDNNQYVGIKGLPGRPGIGTGHEKNTYGNKDTNHIMLKKWIPKDYQVYLDVLKTVPAQELNHRRVEMGWYIASKRGLAGKVLVEPGEKFYWEGPKGSWMDPVDGGPVVAVAAKQPPPQTDIYAAARELSKKHPSVLDHKHIPQSAGAQQPTAEPIAAEPAKGKRAWGRK
jgi:hypothetical protein